MRVYLDKGDFIVATHKDAQPVPLAAYPTAVRLVFVPDDLNLVPAQSLPDDEGQMGASITLTRLPDGWLEEHGDGSPASVPKLQLQRALRQMGHGEALRASLAAASEDDQDDWVAAQTVARSDEMLARLAKAMKLKPATLDEAFRLADEQVTA